VASMPSMENDAAVAKVLTEARHGAAPCDAGRRGAKLLGPELDSGCCTRDFVETFATKVVARRCPPSCISPAAGP
jgi:hypothetical protein